MRVRKPLAVLMLGVALTGCGDNRNPNEVDPSASSTTTAAVTTSGAAVTATTSAGPVTTSAVTTSAQPAAETVKVGKDADGQVIRLAIGQRLEVQLAANPTTGYAWQLATLDQNIVKQDGGIEYEQDPSPDGMVGVGGKSLLKFTAVAPGATRLLLEYRRSWEQGVEPAERFTLDLSVN